jgi:tol-pal system protein YbgF
MTCIHLRPAILAVVAATMAATACIASAQDAAPPPARDADPSPFGILGRVFGGSDRFTSPPAQAPAAGSPQLAQVSGAELIVRLDRLETQIRQLTGVVEQLQYRNQQLEGQLRRLQEEAEARGGPRPAPARPATTAPTTPPTGTGRRGDAFDPAANPNAPGAPRIIGSTTPTGSVLPGRAGDHDEAPFGAPGGRAAGAPLDLSTLAGNAGGDPPLVPPGSIGPSEQPPAAARNPSGSGAQVATLPPTDSPKDNYDLAYGYILRKDYALAEDGFRGFLKKYPSDRLASDAQYWLGESLYQRQRFRDAAEAFLNVSTKYESTAKAPDALLRLGQALAALGEKEAACASLGEVLRKYPRASVSVKQGVDREQKRVHC